MIVIDAPHFHAAVVLGPTSRVIRTHPILSYMLGWDRQRVVSDAERKGWRATWVD
ncbi:MULTISPECIES: hypothetical protein [Bradyrhizobium]|uniref:Transposase n=1 Tax=Bradyrhizobium yuanmingense TaxID=108015 RepID=A0ABV4GJX0_9BRAD|nr:MULTISPECIES: hypothetical protein [Bradyrhizobium]MCA1390216.1 hypothetical protein [Bradyrhizobium sp. IC3123]MCA1416639.1 hypothetical protein [Bradyrhizobium sp. NBAIM20]MCA1438517.1 hypothetical protein [Bradyrhizobium sp. BRP20]MCA1466211.1 hypothetical protein [Bradyrhizobium sp. NBAIM18]MCA1473347.1 hypothetical protein [Bradyrhizobium sp. IC3195]